MDPTYIDHTLGRGNNDTISRQMERVSSPAAGPIGAVARLFVASSRVAGGEQGASQMGMEMGQDEFSPGGLQAGRFPAEQRQARGGADGCVEDDGRVISHFRLDWAYSCLVDRCVIPHYSCKYDCVRRCHP